MQFLNHKRRINRTIKPIAIIMIGLVTVFTACKKGDKAFENGYDDYSGNQPSDYFKNDSLGVDKSFYGRARIFPGLVSDAQRRIADTVITLNMKYSYVPAATLGVNAVPQPIFSTGLYAAPGELIEIDVPENILGLNVYVGSHLDNLTGQTSTRRDALISTVKALFPGVNTVRNLYGGYIWIKAANSIANPVTFHFKRVVATSDYILGTTTDVAAWQRKVMASGVPWLELRSQHVALSVSRDWVLQGIQNGTLNNIDQTMAEWDKVMVEDYYKWLGWTAGNADATHRAPELPERAVMDVQITGNSLIHNGQPIMALTSANIFDEWANYTTLSSGNSVITNHELGRNYKMSAPNFWWKSVAESETVQNFNLMKTASRNNLPFPALASLGPNSLSTVGPVALAFANRPAGKYMDNDPTLAGVGTTFRLMMFLQIFAKSVNPATGENGLGLIPYVTARAQTINNWSVDDQTKRNFFFTALCDYTQKDYSNFFDAWGIPISTITRGNVQQKYPLLADPIWTYDPIKQVYVTDNYPVRTKRIYTNRSNWVITASDNASQEGSIAAMIDGIPETYWHACYSGCTPLASPAPVPHVINIDMGSVSKISGCFMASRMSGRQVTQFVFSYSNDNINFTTVGTFPMLKINYNQEFTFATAVNARYVRFTIDKNSYDNTAFSAVAELGTFYDGN